jgi:hypothetical protein
MISRLTITLAFLQLALVGCQSEPAPSPGMSGVSIRVVAEPKAGVKDVGGGVKVYDTPVVKEQGQFEKVDYSALDDIVVWVEPVSPSAPVGSSVVRVSINAQKPAEKLSAVAAVGQRLILHNSGSAALNLYSVSDGNDFDLGKVAAGGQGQYTVRSAGLIEVLAASDRDPVAEIYAAPSRWVALTHSGARVDFNNLPPGNYKVCSWHPRLPGTEASITLVPNQISKTTIKVGVNALPKVGPR